MTEYAIGDALEDAVNDFRMSLLGGGNVQIGVHNITRDCFDKVPGEESHFDAAENHSEFWTKPGFVWDNDRHRISVTYFTNEAPVVVPLHDKARV